MEIYSAARETGLSKGDELAREQQVPGSDPPGGQACERPRGAASVDAAGYSQGELRMRVHTQQSIGCRDVAFSASGVEQENTLQRLKGAQMANLHSGAAAAGGWKINASICDAMLG